MSSSTAPGDRSAEAIERDVERSRARLVGTAEELKQRVSPGNMAEQAVDWLRGSGGTQFMTNLGTTLRDNPVPVLLIAGGIAWLAMGGRGAARRWPEDEGSHWRGADHAGSGPSMTERAGEVASAAADAAGSAWETTRDAVRSAAGSVGAAARDATATVTDAAGRAGEALSPGGRRRTRGHHPDDAADDGHGMMDAFERQPLLFGALGLAVGATLGALLPSTEAEDRLMGEPRDQVAGRVSEMAEQAYGKARESLGEVAGDLKEAVARTAEQVTGTPSAPQDGSATGVRPARSGPEGQGPV